MIIFQTTKIYSNRPSGRTKEVRREERMLISKLIFMSRTNSGLVEGRNGRG